MISFKKHSNYYVLEINSVPIRIDFKGNILDKDKLRDSYDILQITDITMYETTHQRKLTIKKVIEYNVTVILEIDMTF